MSIQVTIPNFRVKIFSWPKSLSVWNFQVTISHSGYHFENHIGLYSKLAKPSCYNLRHSGYHFSSFTLPFLAFGLHFFIDQNHCQWEILELQFWHQYFAPYILTLMKALPCNKKSRLYPQFLFFWFGFWNYIVLYIPSSMNTQPSPYGFDWFESTT